MPFMNVCLPLKREVTIDLRCSMMGKIRRGDFFITKKSAVNRRPDLYQIISIMVIGNPSLYEDMAIRVVSQWG